VCPASWPVLFAADLIDDAFKDTYSHKTRRRQLASYYADRARPGDLDIVFASCGGGAWISVLGAQEQPEAAVDEPHLFAVQSRIGHEPVERCQQVLDVFLCGYGRARISFLPGSGRACLMKASSPILRLHARRGYEHVVDPVPTRIYVRTQSVEPAVVDQHPIHLGLVIVGFVAYVPA
jgi:hypothetical protein